MIVSARISPTPVDIPRPWPHPRVAKGRQRLRNFLRSQTAWAHRRRKAVTLPALRCLQEAAYE